MAVKFQLDADASKVVRAYELAASAQDKVERNMQQMARAAEKSCQQVQQAVKAEVRAYELADQQVERSVQARAARGRTRSVREIPLAPISRGKPNIPTYIPAATGGAYEVVPNAADHAAMIQARFAARRTSSAYLEPARIRGTDLGDTDAVAFARWQKAQELRAMRARNRARAGRGMLHGAVMGVAAPIGAGLALGGRIFSGIAEERGRIGAENAAFEREMRELYTVDDNVTRMPRLRQQVLAGSTAYGISRGEYADALTTLHSSVGNLPAQVGDQIMRSASQLTDVAGGRLNDNLMALIKTYQVYGKEAGTVEQIQAKLFKTVEDGIVTIEDVSQLLPDVIPAARAFGVSMDEVAGALIVATQAGGRSEKTFTGFRNIILRMNNAEREGITLTGSLTEKLEQLSKVDPQTLERIFGAQAISVLSNLVQKTDQLRDSIRDVSQMAGDEVIAKGFAVLADAPTMAAKTRQSIDQMITNAALQQGLDNPGMLIADLETQMAEYGYEARTHPLAKRVAEEMGQKWTNIKKDFGELKGWGMEAFVADMEKSGDPLKIAQARAAQLLLGAGQIYGPGRVGGGLAGGTAESYHITLPDGGRGTIDRTEIARQYMDQAAKFPDIPIAAFGTSARQRALGRGEQADVTLATAVHRAAERRSGRAHSAFEVQFDTAIGSGMGMFGELLKAVDMAPEIRESAKLLNEAAKTLNEAVQRSKDIWANS